ncbi:MAG: tRNA lysidine(34) synthetase TilS [bacterium]|jgi:tRNA(Ile)-lysidine synthase
MLQKLQEYIDKHRLFATENKLLLAVSGGLDSVVMLDLLHRLGYDIQVAHMNFNLRGDESNQDEVFVRNLCQRLKVEFHVKQVDTLKLQVDEKISIQMAARKLRYDWFQELREKFKIDYLLTAHHADDSIETVLINILRGTGLSGLKGIVHNDMGVRPMLCFSRSEIHDYAKANHIQWREDSSNSKEDYLRNKLRLNIMPQLDNIAHQWRANVLKLSEDIAISEKILEKHFQEDLIHIFSNNIFDINQIKNREDGCWLFRKSLLNFNFSHGTIDDIILNIDSQSGAIFSSNTHRLIKDRNKLILEALIETALSEEIIIESDLSIKNVSKQRVELKVLDISERPESFQGSEIYVDYDKLEFPIQIRHWQAGDWFIPMGMKGKKKLSDFFIDEKFSIQKKENTFVIVSGKIIAAILNNRVDDRYKITGTTNRILKVILH